MRKQGRVGMKGQTLPVTAKVTKLDTSMIEGAKGAITIAATVAVGKSIMTAGQDLQSMSRALQLLPVQPIRQRRKCSIFAISPTVWALI